MANDPVLQRSMFQKQGPSVTPAVGLGTGIGSVTTPDQNAQALRSMFQPTVSIGAPTEMLQQGQPVQSFQEGGLARLLPSFLRPTPPTEDELARVAQRAAMRRMAIDEQYMDEARQPQREPLVAQYTFREPRNFRLPPSYLERTDPARFEAERPAREAAAEEARARNAASLDAQRARYLAMGMGRRQAVDDADALSRPVPAREVPPDTMSTMEGFLPPDTPMSVEGAPEARRRFTFSDLDYGRMGGGEVYSNDPSRSVMSQVKREETPPTEDRKPPREDSLQLTLKEIKAERAADRRENALLALMQAGFAIAGGRSPNAISNIGAGGQAGIGAFAAMERASREDAAARRRDAIQLASAERQFALAERQLERDPEAVRTYAILGGYKPGDPKEAYQAAVQRGFNVTQSKEGPKLAAAIINNPLSTQFYSQQDLKDLADYAKRGIVGMGGGGGYSGFRDVTPR